MFMTKQHLVMARTFGVAIIATLGLSACATYDDEFAGINSRLDQLDTRVQGAAQSAESANQSAQQANQRLDQIESRVQKLEAVVLVDPCRQPCPQAVDGTRAQHHLPAQLGGAPGAPRDQRRAFAAARRAADGGPALGHRAPGRGRAGKPADGGGLPVERK